MYIMVMALVAECHYSMLDDEIIDDMLSVLPKSLILQSDAIVLKDVIGRGTLKQL